MVDLGEVFSRLHTPLAAAYRGPMFKMPTGVAALVVTHRGNPKSIS
jgi:hypothetical protein